MNDVYLVIVDLSKECNKSWDEAHDIMDSHVRLFLNRAELPVIDWGWEEIDNNRALLKIKFPTRQSAHDLVVLLIEKTHIPAWVGQKLFQAYPTLKEKLVVGWAKDLGMQEGK